MSKNGKTIKQMNAESIPGYLEVRNGSLYYLPMDSGFLHVEGPDRFDFLQRQTTNDINSLTPKQTITTVLVSPTARIVDVFNLFIDGNEEKLSLISLPGYVSNTARFLQSRIFFMDNVTVIDSSADINQIILGGRQAKRLLSSMGIDPIPELAQVVFGTIAGIQVRVLGEKVLQKSGYRLVFTRESREMIETQLHKSGAVPIPSESYQVLRIEAGSPAAGAELVEEYTPLEAGLEAAISTTKGCYTGQEVIARQLTYDKVTKHLVGLRLEKPVDPGEHVSVEGKTSGTITSSTISPSFGPIALAYIKRPYHQPGRSVSVNQSKSGVVISATVSALPFT